MSLDKQGIVNGARAQVHASFMHIIKTPALSHGEPP